MTELWDVAIVLNICVTIGVKNNIPILLALLPVFYVKVTNQFMFIAEKEMPKASFGFFLMNSKSKRLMFDT